MIIAFTVNNRPGYLKRSLESWSRVRGIGEAELLFQCEPGCPEAVEVCRAASFTSAHYIVNESRAGVLAAPWLAMERAFGLDPFVVLAEEDVVVSSDVLEYFAWAAEEYRGDPGVRMVCAFRHDEPAAAERGAERSLKFSPLVWGTWRDTWEKEIRGRWDFDYSRRGWDYAICEDLLADSKCVIQPSRSRSQHIGRTGGAHCTEAMFESTLAPEWQPDYAPGSWEELSC
jgi:hypothetical protein